MNTLKEELSTDDEYSPIPEKRPNKGVSAKQGEAVQIVRASEEHSFELDEDALTELLMQDDIKDRYVCVVSVAGAYRRGKSFLLNFFLRYLYAKYLHPAEEDRDWLGDENEPLSGFSWRGGCERNTTGILMWSDIFLYDSPNGDKVAIVLLDTQGAFDSQSTVRECATVFALSTMLSSVQIYNLSQNIQENDLQHLELFTEYGRLALADSGEKPFQRLQLLVRDWGFPYDYEYGEFGGCEIFRQRLEVSEKQNTASQSLRRHIAACFEELACFLLPHPGLNVTTNPTYDGRMKDVAPIFKDNLRKLVPMLLAPENLVLKEVGGQRVRARDLVLYFRTYMSTYKANKLPEPKNLLAATAEANHLAALAEAKERYSQLMQAACGIRQPYLNSHQLSVEHTRAKKDAMRQFARQRKMGGEEMTQRYRRKLNDDIEAAYVSFKGNNETKYVLNVARTPVVFLGAAVVMFVLGEIYHFLMFLSMVMLVLWIIVKYSGNMSVLGAELENLAIVIWDQFIEAVPKQRKHVETQTDDFDNDVSNTEIESFVTTVDAEVASPAEVSCIEESTRVTEKNSAPVNTEKNSAPVNTEKNSAPVNTEKNSAPVNTEHDMKTQE